ncbi:MAG TPA: hypothetical protein VFX88_08180 [Actinomycetota bacterium]|nr:hypothetical protein [Actinomycetota bacterium]
MPVPRRRRPRRPGALVRRAVAPRLLRPGRWLPPLPRRRLRRRLLRLTPPRLPTPRLRLRWLLRRLAHVLDLPSWVPAGPVATSLCPSL